MLFAKALFALAVGVLYLAFGWAVAHFARELSWWQFLFGLCLYLPPSTYLFYLAGMVVERGRRVKEGETGRITKLGEFVVILLLPLAMAHNAFHNWLPMTLLFLWPSLRPATTMRLNDYADAGRGRWSWHKPLAEYIRAHLLNWADPDGLHK